eukprot:COSAG02_NODE_13432_length_1396_cov_1.024672_1_plen_106_part_10
MAGQSGSSIPRHIGVLKMPDGSTWYGPSYLSPDQVTGKQEGMVFGFSSEVWMDDGTKDFAETYDRLNPPVEKWAQEESRGSAEAVSGVGGKRLFVTPTNGPTGHGN